MLYLVPTPVGNLSDMTFRAIEILKSVDLILAEDTRVSRKLCNHYDISTPLSAFHTHNEHKKTDGIVDQLSAGKNIALVTDAGTPGISDPGFLLVRAALKAKVELTCLPGATAFVPALVMSGLPSNRFYFEGFLPQKKGRNTRWQVLKELKTTIILYESPFRVVKLCKEVMEHLSPETPVCMVREISKLYEESISGTALEVLEKLEAKPSIKGEFVVLIDNAG